MPPEPTTASRHDVEAKLKQLRDFPVDTAGSQDSDMLPLHANLMRVKPGSDGRLHWFCPRAEPVTRELATFLLRLHAYSNEKVDEWRKHMEEVWNGCADCIRCMDEAKIMSKTTYFGAFSDAVLSRFWVNFQNYEVQTIIEALTHANVTPGSGKSLADVPSPLFYHILSKPAALGNTFLLKVISSQPFLPRAIDWPMEPPPAGYFLLVVHEDKDIRDWAAEHLAKAKPIPLGRFDRNHELALRILLTRLGGKDAADVSCGTPPLDPLAREISDAFPFSGPQKDIWAGLSSVLHLIPAEVCASFGLHRTIMAHLHDNGPHFREILRCMLHAVKKLSSKLWIEENVDYPTVVFDSIKDNPSYTNLVLAHDAEKEQPWFLFFFSEYLRSIWNTPSFGDVLAKFVAFTCSELQHERFERKRSLVMSVAMQILSAALKRANKLNSSSHRQTIMDVLDIHYDFIVSVSLSDEYGGLEWSAARQQSLSLIRDILAFDVEQVVNAIVGLSSLEPSVSNEDVKRLSPIVRRQVWWKVYANITAKTVDGVSILLSLAARTAKLDKLSKKTVSRTIWKYYDAKNMKPSQDILEAVNSAVDSVNTSLTIFRDGFLAAVTRFVNHNTSKTVADAIRQNVLAEHLVFLMLSPVEDLHVAAQTFIGQAYDVDGRPECFREILKAQPESSFNALHRYITGFNSYALKVTEACNVSKALVRCMTDVLEVLGNSPDGLLKDPMYIKRGMMGNFVLKDELPKLWKSMTTSIAVIFKRTPKWAVYFDNKVMTEWMRDALIFARDLLERRRVFEIASLASPEEDIQASPTRPSSIGKKMVEDLQDVLLELQAWLRLTDMELLYQSLALLKAIFQCFRTLDVKPSSEALDKLLKFIEQIESPNDAKRVSFLNKTDLAELELTVAELAKEDEDEVEIVSVSWKSKGKRKSTGRVSSPEVEEIEESVIRKKPKTAKELIPNIFKVPSKTTKQTKLPFSGTSPSKLKSLVPKPPQKAVRSVVKPIVRAPVKREPKFEGTIGPRPTAKPAAAARSRSPSSSESDDSESDGLAYITKRPSPKKQIKRRIERPRIKVIEDPKVLQARLEAQERLRKQEEARRDALRLKPDVSGLHRAILSWNYDHEGCEPPMPLQALNHVPDSFSSPNEYQQIFRPLLMLEAWSQIVKSKEETAPETVLIKVEGRSYQHPCWLDLEASVVVEPTRLDWRLTPEVDIVLLRHTSEKRSLMAKSTGFRRTEEGITLGLRCCTMAHDKDPGLSIGSRWNANLVFSLTTLHREYAALVALPYYDMVDVILRPKLSDPPVLALDEVHQTMKAYRVNEPQARAIISAMKTTGFSLIQGPPGTGKTWTICGLVGAFLSSRGAAPTRIAVPGTFEQPNEKLPVKKLLICAPSNAAVDEITKRLIEGVYGSDGRRLTPRVVRVGAEAQINISAKEYSLDSLVEARINPEGSTAFAAAEAKALRAEIEQVKITRQKKTEELQTALSDASRLSLENEVMMLNAKRITLSQKLDQLRDEMKSQNRSNDALRRRYRQEILTEADIICSTLSGAGHEQLLPFDFSMVIIDEASQSIELSSLIPLKYRCTRCVMVGDPQQLPPTVLSPEAAKWGYDQSLFVRMQKHRPSAVHLLSIQYRMHPEISLLPSKVFYGGRLQDGPDMDKKTAKPWHADPRFGPYRFYSVEHGREEAGLIGHSLLNRDECRMILFFYEQLRRQFPSVNFDYRVGIVSMYRSQMQELRNMFKRSFGREILTKIDFNTVDGFQGQEKDIIILSCVRAGPSLATVGFVSDVRRMNVAITRSKSSLFIFGHAPTLQRGDKVWKDIIDDARSRSCFVELKDTSYFIGRASNLAQTSGENKDQPMPRKRDSHSTSKKQAQETPEVALFSPKKAKLSASRKLPRGVNLVNSEPAVNAIASALGEKNEPPTENKSNEREREEQGLQLNEKLDTEPAAVVPGSSIDPQRHMPPIETRPPNINGRAAAQKELEAFRRRKREATNPFLKR